MPSQSILEDKLIWNHSQDGKFTMNSAYINIQASSNNQGSSTSKDFMWIWKFNAPKKIKTFLWLLLHKRLPTSIFLNHIGMGVPSTCKQCPTHQEDISHIFFHCPKAFTFWTSILFHCNTISTLDLQDINSDNWVTT